MALFPAFSEVAGKKVEDSSKELDWLNNKSFQTGEALSLHSRFLEKTEEKLNQREESVGLDVSSNEGEEKGEDEVPPRKKKKKSEKKRKKKKKNKKKSGSSGSDSDNIYPSDLKREKAPEKQKAAPLASTFSWMDDVQSTMIQHFCVDKKPDPANWTYKSLYRGNVARYKRKGSSALGLDFRTQGVNWEESETKKKRKAEDSKKSKDRYFSTASRRLLRSEVPVPAFPKTPDSNMADSFLPLGEDNKSKETAGRVQTSCGNPLGVYDSSTALWLQGKGPEEQIPEAKMGESTAPLTGKTEEFNRRLREQPADTQLWIDFIRYQDELSASMFGGEASQTEGEAAEHGRSSYRAVLEKKLSIAERAVASNPACIALQLQRLQICQELWEPAALAKEWKKLVFLHPNSAPLWRQYLLFTQSYFSNFSVSRVSAAFGKCLSVLSSVRDGSMVSHPALPGTEEDMLDIFTQQCHFLRQAGHSEKAVSLFQAMIDFTFFKPDSVLKLSTRQQVEFFEPFWDSGEARVGEFGARGWRAWMHQQERGGWLQPDAEEEEEDEEEEEEEVGDRTQPRWRVWLNVESSRETGQWLPWRPDKAKGQSEEDCEDPDRQVLFDDIGPSLICFSSPNLQLRLLLNFLSFLGLPVASGLSAAPCLPGMLLENLSLLTQDFESQHPLTSSYLPEPGSNSVGHMTTLQGGRKWAGLGKQGEKFLSNVLSVIQPLLPPAHRSCLALSLIQYEKLKVWRCLRRGNKRRLRLQGKSSRRVSKRLLKEPENRSCLALWREFAHLEWMLGNLEEARKVFSTATGLGGGGGGGAGGGAELCELNLLWAQLELEAEIGGVGGGGKDGEPGQALCVLTRFAEGNSSSQQMTPVAILKARKSYELALNSSLSALPGAIEGLQQNREGPEDHLRLRGLVGCYALFQYLTVGLQAAAAIFVQAAGRLEEIKMEGGGRPLASEREALATQQAALTKMHSRVGQIPLETLRLTLTSALKTWPSSAALWSLYLQVENRYHSAGRARRFFHSVTRESKSVVPRLFAIVAEQQRKQLVDSAQRSCGHDEALPVLPENGLSNRIRALFENATASEMGAHCPVLWRMYIHFLVSEGKVDKARGIFYKALQNIPWVKGVYMDAVQLFPEQLQEFVDLMTEKELRVRIPLEELDILLED
ncbi:LOW QUALITY PROTEIN: nuclear exosome regulator NRDE2 [Menidia menidia]